MPIIAGKGKEKLNEAGIRAIKDMLKGSIESHISVYEKEYPIYTSDNVSKSSAIFVEEFKKALAKVDDAVDKAVKSGSSVTAEAFMQGFYSDLAKNITNSIENAELRKNELNYAKAYIYDFGDEKTIKDYLKNRFKPVDSDEGYEMTDSAFKLAEEPIPGIEEIGHYDPNSTSVGVLYEARSANSGTLKNKVEDRLNELNDPQKQSPEAQEEIKNKLSEAKNSLIGLHAVGETARIYSSELMNKDNITFGDLYDVFTGLNKAARLGDENGGKLRGQSISAGGIIGVGTFVAPKDLYKTLSKVADMMNQIKKTENEALRKTQAVQLASYTYLMTLSEHVFGDGNGRTCRMFADTILQTFGLPPHTPDPQIMDVGKTIGDEPMDFNKGAQIFLTGIKQSDQVLKARQDELKSLPGGAERQDKQVTSIENTVKNIAEEAGEKLKALESMQKKGHKNGKEYQAMYDALQKASRLDPSKDSLSFVEKALDEIDRTSKEYEKAHTGWFKASNGYGADRLKLSQENQKFVSFRRDTLNGFSKGFSKFTVISAMHPDLSEPAPSQAESKKVKSVSLSQLEEKDAPGANKNEAPGKRRNTIAGTKKNMGAVL